MKKTLLLAVLLTLGSPASYGGESENTELTSMLSIYTASVEGPNRERLSVAIVRQAPTKAALYQCTKAFLGSAGNDWEVVDFFSSNCRLYEGFPNYNVQKNYLTDRQRNRVRVVFSGTGSLLQPNSGELFSDVTTYSADIHNGSGARTDGTVDLVGSRVTHYEREAPKMSTYRLTFFHSASVRVKNLEEIEN